MKIQKLIKDIEILNNPDIDQHLTINGLTDNSAEVNQGYVFVAIKGFSADGHNYIDQAIQTGASVIIGEIDMPELPVLYIKVKNSRKALGLLSKNFYKNPSLNKVVVGVTGTNGKTTISYLLKSILEFNGISCSLIGTIENVINGETLNSSNTTPSSLELHKLLSKSKDSVVVMEVSSHGLNQDRLEGIEFDVCLFTNLEHEHLDYHGSIEEYFYTKYTLFEKMKSKGTAVVNTDDFWGEKLNALLQSNGKNVLSIGKSKECSLRIVDAEESIAPFICVEDQFEKIKIGFPMPGIHNLYNAVMAYATSKLLDIKKENSILALQHFPGVNGRFEIYPQPNGATAVIDYAHTADAFLHCLTTAKKCGAARVIHIFGFRGDRDEDKRKEMISISSELSDLYILTLDDLNSIPLNDMLKHLHRVNEKFGKRNGLVIPDRTLAIKEALEFSREGDWILITGKGHEKYQHQFQIPAQSDKDTILYINNHKSR